MFKTKEERSVPSPAPAPAADQERYTSGDVARIAGVSLRQLQWWDERNVVSPRQEGHRRVYLPHEVVEVSVIAELRAKGFSLQKIRRVLRFLQQEMGKRLSDAVANNSDVHLVTDGKHIYLEDQPDRVIEVLKNAKQPMFLVCVTDQLRRFQSGAVHTGVTLNRAGQNGAGRKPVRSEAVAPARKKTKAG